MEEDEIQAQQGCKFPRLVHQNGRNNNESSNNWNHHSSRIIRVSRASGGKDRHSKVMTSKGLRDRRVRLSVTTAIQFYDLQDRLGYDQPSKAVEWLIKSAADAIAELPCLNNTFPPDDDTTTPTKLVQVQDDHQHHEKGGGDSGDGNYNNNNQSRENNNVSLSKSACSSTSETSKGSGLSLSRSDIRVNRVKARERARERAAKEKENESHMPHQHQNLTPISQTASFTELLTGGPDSRHQHQQQQQQWCSSAPMDYFTSGLLGASSSSSRPLHHQIQLGHSTLADHAMSISPFHVTSTSSDHHHHHSSTDQHFSFIPDHLMQPVVVTSSSSSSSAAVVSQSGTANNNNEYNLNLFTISSGLAAAGSYNRGTLQSNSSNSPSSLILPHHLQRFSSPLDGSSSSTTVPAFFIGAPAAPNSMENNNHHHYHQFSSVFDGGRFQLYHGDPHRHSTDHKGKAKN